MLVTICMRFHDGILNVFLNYRADMTISQNLLFSISKGHISKNTQSRATVLALCTSSHVALHLCKVSWKYLKRFFSYRVETILWQTDGRTADRRPGQKQYVSQPYRGRHNNTQVYCFVKWKLICFSFYLHRINKPQKQQIFQCFIIFVPSPGI